MVFAAAVVDDLNAGVIELLAIAAVLPRAVGQAVIFGDAGGDDRERGVPAVLLRVTFGESVARHEDLHVLQSGRPVVQGDSDVAAVSVVRCFRDTG